MSAEKVGWRKIQLLLSLLCRISSKAFTDMTNIQRSTADHLTVMESTEEIHLTELLPVKQSAICCKNSDDKDDIVADAFKALREGNKHFSLSGNEFCTEDNKDFGEKIDRDEKESPDDILKNYVNTKRTHDGRDKSARRNPLKQKINRRFKEQIKYVKKRRHMVPQSKEINKQNQREKKFLVTTTECDDFKRADFCKVKSQNRNSPIPQNFENDVTNEIIEKNGIFNDEIYVFRQSVRSESAKNGSNDKKLKARKNSNSIVRLNGIIKDKNLKESGGGNGKIKENLDRVEDGNEESLREKIDAIIQANYVMEGKNNNTTRENRNKLNDAFTEGSEMDVQNSGEEESSDKKHRCAICDARFKGSGGLRTHYKVVHAAGPTFTCNECGKEFPLKERLKLHVRTHTGYKPYKCTECDKSFARGGQLVQHRRTHTQVKPYRCVLCPGTFSCAANLALHVKRHKGQKDHKCEICGRAFVRRDALKKHLECLHKDVKSFLCVICNKTFKGHLPQHMRTHAQDRPHGCATCGQRFAQKSQLTVHQRTHSGQRPFRCLVCWQAFAHSTALKLHTRRHTGERPFKCAECNAGFTQLPHWKKHMRCVHGRTDPYCCKNCNTFFRIKNDLETHEKSCHVGETNLDIDAENRGGGGRSAVPKYRIMTVEKMRLLLAVLFKRISKPERLDELGFGKRLIDEVLKDSLILAGKDPVERGNSNEFDVLKQNLATFLEWTVPREHWEAFKKLNKSPEEILETLTVSQ